MSAKFIPKLLTEQQKEYLAYQENASTHSAHMIRAFLAKNSMPLVKQASYPPVGQGEKIFFQIENVAPLKSWQMVRNFKFH